MRVFVGLDIPEPIRDAIARYMDGLRNFAPDVRWVRPESFHITLKFIGEQKPEQVERIKQSLSVVRAAPFDIAFRDVGFFPNERRPRVFWVGIHASDALPRLASAVDHAVALAGVPLETHPYKPHLTLSRAGSGRPHPGYGDRPDNRLARLAEKLKSLPQPDPGPPGRADVARHGVVDFGTITAREFYLYESKLSPKGAQYSKLQAFPMG